VSKSEIDFQGISQSCTTLVPLNSHSVLYTPIPYLFPFHFFSSPMSRCALWRQAARNRTSVNRPIHRKQPKPDKKESEEKVKKNL